MITGCAVWAVFKRNFFGFFKNPTGYVFITLFIFISAIAAFWGDDFFKNNLANLDVLNGYFPLILLFFVPALTMHAWAEERRQGTDELLLTLPASDFDIVLGKYFAVLGVYTISLFFSISHLVVLSFLGDPDGGLMFSTYFGYWLMGAGLLAIGMFGSLLSRNATVGFIFGALLCSVTYFVGNAGMMLSGRTKEVAEVLSLASQFRDFGAGLLSLKSVCYFVSLAALFIYFNVLLLNRRRWAGGPDRYSTGTHGLVRAISLVAMAAAINVMVYNHSVRADMTSEGIYSLSKTTKDVLSKIQSDRPVFVRAFFSPEVPSDIRQTKADMIAMLKELQRQAGDKVVLSLVETESDSKEAEEATQFNIETAQSEEEEFQGKDLYLGVAVSCGPEEVVIPFMGKGLPMEYEITRSIKTVIGEKRRVIGVLDNRVQPFGGFNQQGGASQEWEIISELRKQYEVARVSPDENYPENLSVLLVIAPSTLKQTQMDKLREHIFKGKPVMLLNSPENDFKIDKYRANSYRRQQQADPANEFGDLRDLYNRLGINWNYEKMLWDSYQPHPKVARDDLLIFVNSNSGATEPFNAKDIITKNLQEVVFLAAGPLDVNPTQTKLLFTPLVRSSKNSGTYETPELLQRNFFNPTPPTKDSSKSEQVIAARYTGSVRDANATPPAEHPVNLIVTGDFNFITNQIFSIRRDLPELKLDNVTFMCNSIDSLAGDDSLIELRNRRPKHRTLRTVEKQSEQYIKQQHETERDAKKTAEETIKKYRSELEEVRKNLSQETNIGAEAKAQAFRQELSAKQTELESKIKEQEKELKRKQNLSLREKNKNIKAIQNKIRSWALMFSPLPAMLIGAMIVLFRRVRNS